MKLKNLKRTRKALVKLMDTAKTFYPTHTVNMGDVYSCAFGTITNQKWSAEAIYKTLKLVDWHGNKKLSEKLHTSVFDLFGEKHELFSNPHSTTWEEWLSVAAVTEAQLNLAIAKAINKKMKAKYEC